MKKVNNPKPCPGFLITWVALLLAMAASESWPVFPCGPAEKKVRLTIFHPSVGIIQELTKLREERLLDVSHLAVLGVYHQNERTDYNAVRKYVESNRLDWLTFNPISAPLSPESLFQKNACSGEFNKLFEQSDGMIFFGGQDIPPRLYGEKMRLLTEVEDPYRHYLELSFIFHLLGGTQDLSFKPLLERRRNLAVFGICLGCESLNVGTGGTLTQDIWSEIYGVPYLEDAVALSKERWHTNPLYRLYPAVGLFSNVLHPIKLS
jgi:putative glutamine amidotransferase